MGKHDKQKEHLESDDLRDESIGEEVNHIFKEHLNDYISKLEDIGFVYHDDEYDLEEEKESTAQPKNANQKHLVSFLEGHIPLSINIVNVFLEEKRSPLPNYSLFRKYFKSANINLLSLLLYGLEQYPVLEELLSDLAYYHEFQPVRQDVVERYLIACEKQDNLEVFGEFVLDFYYATAADGYDAFHELRNRNPLGTHKRAVIDFLNEIDRSNNNQSVKF